jgi:hypothetical protein
MGAAVLPNKSTMQCPRFSSGVSPGKAGSLPKGNQYISFGLEPAGGQHCDKMGEKDGKAERAFSFGKIVNN